MKLYICEKPSQAKDLARALNISGSSDGCIGNGNITITWAIGHLVQQLNPDEIDSKYKQWNLEDLPIIPDVWQMKANPRTKKQLTVIKRLLKQTNHVVIATDGDREGEVIGRELLDYFNWSGKVERLWLTALDQNSIKKALSSIKQGSETEFLYKAGLARSRADWVVGINATRTLTVIVQKQGYKGVLSVGRVQTPTLAIVVNRDLEIENFKPKDYYDLIGVFSGVAAKWKTPIDGSYFDKEGRCVSLDYARQIRDKVKNSGSATVIKFETQLKKVSPPLLYSLSALQQIGSKKFGFGAKQVLDLAQSLYEKHKATTYPRSDCQYLPESQYSEVKGVMNAIISVNSNVADIVANADLSIKSKAWNDKKLGAHHGIIPTANTEVNISNMTTDECKLYDLICRSYIAQFYPHYEYNKTDIGINAADEIFTANINVDMVLGWKVVISSQAELKQNTVPNIEKGQQLNVDDVSVETKQTKPPAAYTEGTLIAAMEKAHLFVTDPNLKKVLKGNEGIGTEATRANIIDLLLKRNFLNKSKKNIVSSDTGRALIAAVPIQVKDPGMTAIMESSLSKIALGELTLNAFMAWQEKWLIQLINSIKSQKVNIKSNSNGVVNTVLGKCPNTGFDVSIGKGKYGYFVKLNSEPPKFSNIPKHIKPNDISLDTALLLLTLPRDLGMFNNKAIIAAYGKNGGYLKCDGVYINIKDGQVESITANEAQQVYQQRENGLANAPTCEDYNCGKPLVVKDGQYGKWYACTGFPKCRQKQSKKP